MFQLSGFYCILIDYFQPRQDSLGSSQPGADPGSGSGGSAGSDEGSLTLLVSLAVVPRS